MRKIDYEVRSFYGPACTEMAVHTWHVGESSRDTEIAVSFNRKDIGRVETRVPDGKWAAVPRSVIITGPQGSGKNRIATALCARFGCTHVVDDWWFGTALTRGALHLTHYPSSDWVFRDARVYQIEEVRL